MTSVTLKDKPLHQIHSEFVHSIRGVVNEVLNESSSWGIRLDRYIARDFSGRYMNIFASDS